MLNLNSATAETESTFVQESKSRNEERSKTVLKNSFASFFLKGVSIAISFILISLFLNAVDKRQYGIILTIISISDFLGFFDIGIGNGLRNKLGKAIAESDLILARKYVSTGYFYVIVFFTGIFLFYCFLSSLIEWNLILNIDPDELPLLNVVIVYIIALFGLRFILQLIGIILLSDQKSYINDSILLGTQILTIIFYFALKWLDHLNFYTILVSISLAPVLVLLAYSISLFSTKYKWLFPSPGFIDFSLRKDLLGLGMKFFFLQIAAVTVFSTTNILIVWLFTVEQVTEYNIAFKYYGVATMVFGIAAASLWGAFTNAWYHNDFEWIIATMRKYAVGSLFLIVVGILQFFAYPIISLYWLGQNFPLQTLLVFSIILYNFIFSYNIIIAFFLNGIGKISVQLYCGLFGALLNIPLTIWLAKNTHLELSSIVIANIICILPSSIFATIHAWKLLHQGILRELPTQG